MSDDQNHLTIAEIATGPQLAEEFGMTDANTRRYAAKWPDTWINVGGHRFFVRERLAARMAEIDLRPRLRKGRRKPPSQPNGAGETADASK